MLEKNVQTGVLLHRFIDNFTDTHPSMLALKEKMHPTLGKFSGVVLDVLLDHVLSIKWHDFTDQKRDTWIESTYNQLAQRHPEMSEKRRFIAEKMIEHDWMNMYLTHEGTSQILNQMARRIPFDNPLKDSFQLFFTLEKDIISTFDEFFPQILSATQLKLDTFAP